MLDVFSINYISLLGVISRLERLDMYREFFLGAYELWISEAAPDRSHRDSTVSQRLGNRRNALSITSFTASGLGPCSSLPPLSPQPDDCSWCALTPQLELGMGLGNRWRGLVWIMIMVLIHPLVRARAVCTETIFLGPVKGGPHNPYFRVRSLG